MLITVTIVEPSEQIHYTVKTERVPNKGETIFINDKTYKVYSINIENKLNIHRNSTVHTMNTDCRVYLIPK